MTNFLVRCADLSAITPDKMGEYRPQITMLVTVSISARASSAKAVGTLCDWPCTGRVGLTMVKEVAVVCNMLAEDRYR